MEELLQVSNGNLALVWERIRRSITVLENSDGIDPSDGVGFPVNNVTRDSRPSSQRSTGYWQPGRQKCVHMALPRLRVSRTACAVVVDQVEVCEDARWYKQGSRKTVCGG